VHRIPESEFEFDVAGVMVTFRASEKHLAAVRAAEATIQKTAQKAEATTEARLLVLLRRNPFLTRADLAREIGISSHGVKYQLDQLKAAGRLRRKGGRKSGEWEIVE
jgi:ATP-dependent DNA helicase RecG